jgi:hypothetical protein
MRNRPTEDHVTLAPVPDGTRELRYTAEDTQNGMTPAKATAALRAAGHKERLVRGHGYYYFIDGEAFNWPSQGIYQNSIAHMSPADIIRARNELAGQEGVQGSIFTVKKTKAKDGRQLGEYRDKVWAERAKAEKARWRKEQHEFQGKKMQPDICRLCGLGRSTHKPAQAKDGILSTPLFGLAAILAVLTYFNRERVGPESYDLTTYRPERRQW